MTTRRGFLGAMLAACAAPAIVRADSLMRVIPVETEILLPDSDLVFYEAVVCEGKVNPMEMLRIESYLCEKYKIQPEPRAPHSMRLWKPMPYIGSLR